MPILNSLLKKMNLSYEEITLQAEDQDMIAIGSKNVRIDYV